MEAFHAAKDVHGPVRVEASSQGMSLVRPLLGLQFREPRPPAGPRNRRQPANLAHLGKRAAVQLQLLAVGKSAARARLLRTLVSAQARHTPSRDDIASARRTAATRLCRESGPHRRSSCGGISPNVRTLRGRGGCRPALADTPPTSEEKTPRLTGAVRRPRRAQSARGSVGAIKQHNAARPGGLSGPPPPARQSPKRLVGEVPSRPQQRGRSGSWLAGAHGRRIGRVRHPAAHLSWKTLMR
eukprot:363965-Chlamydomonas_euryale.AAC.19